MLPKRSLIDRLNTITYSTSFLGQMGNDRKALVKKYFDHFMAEQASFGQFAKYSDRETWEKAVEKLDRGY